MTKPATGLDPINIGLIGCGGRGSGAVVNALTADPAARLVAAADLFDHKLAAYTGKTIRWDELLDSTEDLTPPRYEFGPLPFPPVAVPGRTKFR